MRYALLLVCFVVSCGKSKDIQPLADSAPVEAENVITADSVDAPEAVSAADDASAASPVAP